MLFGADRLRLLDFKISSHLRCYLDSTLIRHNRVNMRTKCLKCPRFFVRHRDSSKFSVKCFLARIVYCGCRLETASVRSLRQTSKVWVPWVDGPSADHRGADGTQSSILYNIIQNISNLFTFPITKMLCLQNSIQKNIKLSTFDDFWLCF